MSGERRGGKEGWVTIMGIAGFELFVGIYKFSLVLTMKPQTLFYPAGESLIAVIVLIL